MTKEWSEMTPDERREERFKRWMSPEDIDFVGPEAEALYKQRVTRLIDAIKLKEPDRVPVEVGPGYVPAKYAGYTVKDVMYDVSKAVKAWTRYAREIELDILPSASMVRCGKALDMLDSKMYKWAGHGLPDDQSAQYVESDYMKEGEWEYFMKDESDFNIRTYLPRTYGVAKAFAKLPPLKLVGEFGPGMDAFLDPEVQAAFKAFGEAGKVSATFRNELKKLDRQIQGTGLPPFHILVKGGAPLDNVGAFLRGTRGTITDMFRYPDLIHQYMERAVPESIENSKITADLTGIPVMSMPLHRGADGFMNEEQFNTFYWPYLKRVMLGQIEEGLVPLCFAEGGYNTRLDIIKDFPRGKAIWYFDQTNMKRAKEVLGDVYCLMGNVPISLMVTGSAGEVKSQSKKIIEDAGEGGGFILAPGATSDDVKVENIKAMMAASKEFGVYRK